MSKYKVGDRVQIVRSPFCGESRRAGAVGTISRVPSRIRGEVEIEFEDDAGPWGFHFDEIEHVGYKPVPGDRVRVVLEGEVESVTPGYGIYLNDTQYRSFARDEHVVSVEKIEPPVEFFKPGDVVRAGSGGVYLVLENGFATIKKSRVGLYRPGEVLESDTPFTSKHYERVTLS